MLRHSGDESWTDRESIPGLSGRGLSPRLAPTRSAGLARDASCTSNRVSVYLMEAHAGAILTTTQPALFSSLTPSRLYRHRFPFLEAHCRVQVNLARGLLVLVGRRNIATDEISANCPELGRVRDGDLVSSDSVPAAVAGRDRRFRTPICTCCFAARFHDERHVAAAIIAKSGRIGFMRPVWRRSSRGRQIRRLDRLHG
jgi:hypothetical protein